MKRSPRLFFTSANDFNPQDGDFVLTSEPSVYVHPSKKLHLECVVEEDFMTGTVYIPDDVVGDHDIPNWFNNVIAGFDNSGIDTVFVMKPDRPYLTELCRGKLDTRIDSVSVRFNALRILQIYVVYERIGEQVLDAMIRPNWAAGQIAHKIVELYSALTVSTSTLVLKLKPNVPLPPVPRLLNGWKTDPRPNYEMVLRGPLAGRERQAQLLRNILVPDSYEIYKLPADMVIAHSPIDKQRIWRPTLTGRPEIPIQLVDSSAVFRWPHTCRSIIDLTLVFQSVLHAPYTVLWLLDWLPELRRWPEWKKVLVLEACYKSIRGIIEARELLSKR